MLLVAGFCPAGIQHHRKLINIATIISVPQTLDPDQLSMSDKTCRCSALSIATRVRFNKLNLNNVVLCAEISDS